MQLSKKSVAVFAWMFVCIIFVLAQNIQTSFDVQDSCTPEQRKLLDQSVTETLELVDTAREGIKNVAKDVIMQQNLLMYLGTRQTKANRDVNTVESESWRKATQFAAVWSILIACLLFLQRWHCADLAELEQTGMLRDVRLFLEDKLDAFGGGKPRLYCSSKWWQQKQPGDLAQDTSGDPIPEKTIRDKYGHELDVVDDKHNYAYWSDDYKTYEFGDDTGGEFYCDNESNLAGTDDSPFIRPIALTMCPSSFSLAPVTNPPSPPRTTALGDTRPRDGQSLNELQPRSITFFHEVINVIRGVKATTNPKIVGGEHCKSACDKAYTCDVQAKPTADGCPLIIQYAQANPAGARKNPDNYAFFALSYWYWQKRKYSEDVDSKELAADDEPGVRYSFVNSEGNGQSVPSGGGLDRRSQGLAEVHQNSDSTR
ncbi:MAG: hypothetical protein Q9221_008602 [Calogaya cf. arnoldii]